MEQKVLFEIANPCIQVCEMDEKGYCKGCLRNRIERDLWYQMTDSQKSHVMRLLFLRKMKKPCTPQRISTKKTTHQNLTLFDNLANDDTLRLS